MTMRRLVLVISLGELWWALLKLQQIYILTSQLRILLLSGEDNDFD